MGRACPLHIQSGKLIIGDDAAISQPAQAAVPAVFVDNNEQSKDRGTLEFKGKATLTGGLLIQNWGKLVGGLKEGTIITSNGTRILIPKKAVIDFFTSRKSFFTRLAIIVATSNVCQHNILNGCLFKQHIRQFFLHFRHVICNSGEAKG